MPIRSQRRITARGREIEVVLRRYHESESGKEHRPCLLVSSRTVKMNDDGDDACRYAVLWLPTLPIAARNICCGVIGVDLGIRWAVRLESYLDVFR